MKLLSVGNSFSVNAHTYLREITQSMGFDLTLFNCVIGGCTFERHMRHADAYDANPSDPEGSPYPRDNEPPVSLHDALLLDKWDVVTIQQASHESFRPESYHPHADRLVAYIRKLAPTAEIVVHETWPYREDHGFWGSADINPAIMYEGLRKAYSEFCSENGFRMIPCGDAFWNARAAGEWKWNPGNAGAGKTLHDEVGFHTNQRGSYLLGCVWAGFLSGQDVRKATYVPSDVAAADTVALRKIAYGTLNAASK